MLDFEPVARHPAQGVFSNNILPSACDSLGFTGICCRRLRGSTWSYPFPWAYAHGYLLPPLRGSMGRPGVRPGIINC